MLRCLAALSALVGAVEAAKELKYQRYTTAGCTGSPDLVVYFPSGCTSTGYRYEQAAGGATKMTNCQNNQEMTVQPTACTPGSGGEHFIFTWEEPPAGKVRMEQYSAAGCSGTPNAIMYTSEAEGQECQSGSKYVCSGAQLLHKKYGQTDCSGATTSETVVPGCYMAGPNTYFKGMDSFCKTEVSSASATAASLALLLALSAAFF